MASISNDPGGRRRILFTDKDGKRRSIRLGKVSLRLAEEIKVKVEALNAAAVAGLSWDGETARWVGGLSAALAGKLAAVGLIPAPGRREDARLGAFLDAYVAGRTDVKPRTRINLEACRARLVEFFGPDKPLGAITAGDAKDWEIWLKGRYARGTIGRTVKRAKQFFQAAIDKDLLPKNPFAKVKPPSQVNESRKFFVSREAAYQVLEACPDAEWRLLFALSRFGGLRCPSEHFALTWADVDWERARFRVRSPKTEHHEDGGERWVPIFPELRPYLEEAFELAPEGAVHVIRQYRDTNKNLRTRMARIIRRAGLEPWPKLFHNLRASRETELAASYPIHVVCDWIGNTEPIAKRHYLQVTEADFERAAGGGAKSGAPAAQNQAQQAAAPFRTGPQEPAEGEPGYGVMRENATCYESLPDSQLPPRGLEPLARCA